MVTLENGSSPGEDCSSQASGCDADGGVISARHLKRGPNEP